jgi:hypothetical protein
LFDIEQINDLRPAKYPWPFLCLLCAEDDASVNLISTKIADGAFLLSALNVNNPTLLPN